MRTPWLVCGIPIACLCACAAHAGRVPTIRAGVDVSYRGKYARHPLYQRMLAELPALRAEAVRRSNELLGTRYRDDFSIVLRFADATDENDPSRAGDRRRGKLNLLSRARTSNLKLNGKTVVAITFYLEHFVSGIAHYPSTIVHEFAHGIMRQLIPKKKVRKRIAGWFKEGLATLVARQGRRRIRYRLASSRKRDPTDLLTGLEELSAQEKPSGKSYFEYYLHTDFIRRSGGDGALPRLYRLLRKGVRLERAIERVTGQRWKAFRRASDARARRLLRRLARDNHEAAYRRALREGAASLERFLRRHPDSLFAAPARFALARALVAAGKPREAVPWFEEVLRLHLRDFQEARHARLELAGALLDVGQTARAREHLEAYLRDMVFVKPAYRRRAAELLARARKAP